MGPFFAKFRFVKYRCAPPLGVTELPAFKQQNCLFEEIVLVTEMT